MFSVVDVACDCPLWPTPFSSLSFPRTVPCCKQRQEYVPCHRVLSLRLLVKLLFQLPSDIMAGYITVALSASAEQISNHWIECYSQVTSSRTKSQIKSQIQAITDYVYVSHFDSRYVEIKLNETQIIQAYNCLVYMNTASYSVTEI